MAKNKKGFTIIEVVLVLAIAGLIFLMVFIALPALQRSQRNTRRRQDMARILSGFSDFQSNNNGKMPTASNLPDFLTRYASGDNSAVAAPVTGSTLSVFKLQKSSSDDSCVDQFCDPDGTSYAISEPKTGWDWTNPSDKSYKKAQSDHIIGYAPESKCDDSTEGKHIWLTGQKGSISIMYILEGGAVYCGDNQ